MAGAELGPHDIPKLLEILQNALNPNTEIQKSAEAVLQSLGQTPGFSACLAVRSISDIVSHLPFFITLRHNYLEGPCTCRQKRLPNNWRSLLTRCNPRAGDNC